MIKKKKETGKACSTYRIGVYRDLVVESGGKNAVWNFRRRWQDNIKMDIHEVGWSVWTGWIWLSIGAGGGSFKCRKEWMACIKCAKKLHRWKPVTFSRKFLSHGASKLMYVCYVRKYVCIYMCECVCIQNRVIMSDTELFVYC